MTPTTAPDTTPDTETPAGPGTATELLSEVRDQRAARDAAEVRILELAIAWAERHTIDPAVPASCPGSWLEEEHPAGPETLEWRGLPTLRWDTAASFAAALGISTGAGRDLIRDALTLVHRLPRVWAQVQAGRCVAWRARRIAQAVLGEYDDVTTYLDTEIAARAGKVGLVTLDRIIDEAMARLHAEERELAQLEALDTRYAHLLDHTLNHTGIAEFAIRGDWADVAAFDDAVADIAAALAQAGCEESLDVRRSMAVGVLADPARATAVLTNAPAPRARRRIVLNVDLTDANLLGLDPITLDTDGRTLLDQAVRAWCAREDTRVWVRPIRHCGGCTTCTSTDEHAGSGADTDRYTPSARDRETVERRDRQCVFPHCTRPARRSDLDHIIAFARGGPTLPANLAPLCRHHHRLKTFAAWTYTMIEPGVYLWTDRYGQHLLRTRHGTSELSPRPDDPRRRLLRPGTHRESRSPIPGSPD